MVSFIAICAGCYDTVLIGTFRFDNWVQHKLRSSTGKEGAELPKVLRIRMNLFRRSLQPILDISRSTKHGTPASLESQLLRAQEIWGLSSQVALSSFIEIPLPNLVILQRLVGVYNSYVRYNYNVVVCHSLSVVLAFRLSSTHLVIVRVNIVRKILKLRGCGKQWTFPPFSLSSVVCRHHQFFKLWCSSLE